MWRVCLQPAAADFARPARAAVAPSFVRSPARLAPGMYILGLSAMGHDSSAALLGDAGIIAAMEEGKLVRTRSFAGIPRAAMQFCLERAGISWREISHVAIASRPSRAWKRQALFRARSAPFAPVSSGYFLNKASGELGRELNNFRIVKQIAGAAREPRRIARPSFVPRRQRILRIALRARINCDAG